MEYDRLVMVVLKGRVRVNVHPSGHCVPYCTSVDSHTMLSTGDACEWIPYVTVT